LLDAWAADRFRVNALIKLAGQTVAQSMARPRALRVQGFDSRNFALKKMHPLHGIAAFFKS
jgi:hypothetical protein